MDKINIDNFFGRAARPGYRSNMPIDAVREKYILCNKVYSQNVNLQAGQNPDIIVNLPANANKLIGISWYCNFENADENPLLSLTINESLFIINSPVRQFLINNLQSAVIYPLDLPLSGNDRIVFDVNAVTQAKAASLIFHYI